MYWNVFYALCGTGFVLACLVFLSVFGDDKPKPVAPRPTFFVNLLSIALLVILSVRAGEWLGYHIDVETFSKLGSK